MKPKISTITYIFFAVCGRLIPHLPNITPTTNLYLLVGSQIAGINAWLIIIVSALLSDTILAYWNHYPIFGAWTFFNYSAFIVMMLIGRKLSSDISIKRLYIFLPSVTLGFWLWTNLGTWLTTPLYLKNYKGLIQCYIAALPFLYRGFIGDYLWAFVIFGSFKWFQKYNNQKHKASFISLLR